VVHRKTLFYGIKQSSYQALKHLSFQVFKYQVAKHQRLSASSEVDFYRYVILNEANNIFSYSEIKSTFDEIILIKVLILLINNRLRGFYQPP